MEMRRLSILKSTVAIPLGVLSILLALDYGTGSQAAYYVEQGEPMFYFVAMMGMIVGFILLTYGIMILMREDFDGFFVRR
ncbi:MAG TPA: hypothetical protein VGB78_00600 [Thermoplasmata archaeon]